MEFNIKKCNFDFWKIETKNNNTTMSTDLLTRSEVVNHIESINSEVIGFLQSKDHCWWIESIKDEVERAGYKLVKEEE